LSGAPRITLHTSDVAAFDSGRLESVKMALAASIRCAFPASDARFAVSQPLKAPAAGGAA
jgi:hypothetical protein